MIQERETNTKALHLADPPEPLIIFSYFLRRLVCVFFSSFSFAFFLRPHPDRPTRPNSCYSRQRAIMRRPSPRHHDLDCNSSRPTCRRSAATSLPSDYWISAVSGRLGLL